MIPGESAFRIYPVKQDGPQEFSSPGAVCHSCLSGSCCTSEDPIYLTAFDILRLAAFFDLSPAQWMLRYTQDRFEGEDSDERRKPYIEDPDTSVVTYLRRRANYATSPCIFLRYVKEDDGTPRRICGVHAARPLSCREYYFDTCRTRWTGEIASLHAHGYELVRDGRIDREQVERELLRLGPVDVSSAPMRVQLEYSFWIEMQRALDMDRTNAEGARSYDMASYQDPIDEKLNRMLSSAWLRLEEKYGPVPWGEQLHAYDAGLSFVGTAEHARLLGLVQNVPGARPLFGEGDYRHYVAGRAALVEMTQSGNFASLSEDAIAKQKSAELKAALRACEALVRFISFAAAAGPLLEHAPKGKLEREILFGLRRIEASGNPCWKLHPGLRQAAKWAEKQAILPEAWKRKLKVRKPATAALRAEWLSSQNANGTWGTDPSPMVDWPEEQGEYWLGLLLKTVEGVLTLG